ncbi:radical S-adenosyl methionine domain-containing protein 1, mitochondrial [Patella vulgata]|uniref:radical S-adenosyl methionine domain-containing protein 1, mitochondrial n=1 Tax=Patella vulgata TaxID=6465 RepID=UPI00217F4CC3|nr:radical S-adenosyl methionine domain-containing protein 1, mitochondrial [Patella vulgata]XP_050390546.1 radical S-adenosyl methionine domain-containing protein 1, mitochondrial [Patella vulgata]XP_055954612.1 radical S-adenosyl methionine domain-containing protein 1, mitochondrial [Patella vulgata]
MICFKVCRRLPLFKKRFYDVKISYSQFKNVDSFKLSSDEDKKHAALYVHWPYCRKRCPYCNFNKYINEDVNEERMKNCLTKELDTLLEKSCINKLTTVFFGGGTPSLASPDTVKAVIDRAKSHGNLDQDAEITIEVNPTDIEAKKLRAFKDAGVNRISVGLQCLNQNDLVFLGRDHTVEEGLRCLSEAKSLLPGRVSVDLIFGRPQQTKETWKQELKQLLSVCDNHISLYQLTPERGTTLYKQIQEQNVLLPSTEEMADLYKIAVEYLHSNGYEHYEVSNFAKEASYSHHNLIYWTGGEYIGIGPGAHGRLWMYNADEKRYVREARTQTLEPPNWMAEVEKYGHATRRIIKQNTHDRAIELLMTSLRTKWGLSNQVWRKVYPVGLFQLYGSSETINFLQSADFLKLDKRGLRATEKGIAVLDSLIVELVSILNQNSTSSK